MKNWDSEIDDAAREMTRGEVDAGLKARVLARIDALDEPRRIWQSPWILSPIAVAAAAVIAVTLFRAPETVRLKPDTTEAQVRLPRPGLRPGEARRTEPVVSGLPALSVSEGSRTGARARTAAPLSVATGPALVEDLVARASGMESIAPAAIEIDPLGVDSLEAMESIQITRLEVALLNVPLLSDPQ